MVPSIPPGPRQLRSNAASLLTQLLFSSQPRAKVWLDAFSVFKINADGKVGRHILSRHQPGGGKNLAAETAAAAAAGWFPFHLAANAVGLS